jgi:M6 family metalloprotease-like protein
MLRFRVALVLIFAYGATFLHGQDGQGNSQEARLRSLNNNILNLHGQLRAASASQGNSLHSQASGVIAERFAALQALIQQDPAKALELAFDADLLATLKATFPASAAQLESRGSWEGPVDYVILDDHTLTRHRVDITMQVAGADLKIHFPEHEPGWLKCNDIVRVNGVRAGEQVAAAGGDVTGQVAGAGCTTLGDQKVVVILAQFPGIPMPSGVTNAGVQNIFFGTSGRSVDGFWRDASYNKASASGVVIGPVTLDRVYTCNEYNAMRSAAIAAADPFVNFTQYTRVMIVFPNPGSCGWAGLGTLGCSTLSSADGSFQASSAWNLATYFSNVDNGVKLATHEGGHNLTLHHASTRAFTNGAGQYEPIGPVGVSGTHNEYGDTHSTMGSWNLGHYAAPHKQQIGWFSASNVQTVESNGSFSIQPFENITGGVQALKVRRGTGNNAWLWLEFRQAIGQYDSTLNSQVRSGALIHHSDASTGTYTHLLDFTPATGNNFSDAAKLPGTGTWVDPYTNLSFSVDSLVGTAPASTLNVTVSYGAVPCSPANPTVTIMPSSLSGQAGSAMNYTVQVRNNDTAGCVPETFNLGSSNPGGWGTAFAQNSLTINPGATVSTTMTKTSPAGTGVGGYSVNATATRGVNTHTGTASANITAPPVAPVTSVTTDKATYAARQTVKMTATVTSNGSPAAGASVRFTMTKANGATTTKTVTAGSNGQAVWNYKLGPKDPKGTYSVKARATHSGQTGLDSPTINFTVQ